jgi:hypothetical protein
MPGGSSTGFSAHGRGIPRAWQEAPGGNRGSSPARPVIRLLCPVITVMGRGPSTPAADIIDITNFTPVTSVRRSPVTPDKGLRPPF